MKVVLVGEESLLVQCAQKILDLNHEIAAVVAQDPHIEQWAIKNEIPIFPFNAELKANLDPLSFDYLLSIANLKIIPAEILALPTRGSINFHDGPLPHYAGLYTTSWAIINQESSHGVTWHQIEPEIDTGRILVQKTFPLNPDETALSLNAKCFEAGIQSFDTLLPMLTGQMPVGQPQDHDAFVYYAKHRRPAAAATLFWNQPADQIAALTRGLTFGGYENPLAVPKIWTGRTILLVDKPAAVAPASGYPPGTLTGVDSQGIKIAAPAGDILFPALKTDGGQPVTPELWQKLTGLTVGDRLPDLPPSAAEEVTQKTRALVRHESFWARALANLTDVELPYAGRQVTTKRKINHLEQSRPANAEADPIALWLGYLLRLSGQAQFHAVRLLPQASKVSGRFFANQVPVTVSAESTWTATLKSITDNLNAAAKRQTYLRDLVFRRPELAGLINDADRLPLTVGFQTYSSSAERPILPENLELLLAFDEESGELCWLYDQSVFDPKSIQRMQIQFAHFVESGSARPEIAFFSVPLQSENELAALFDTLNNTATAYDASRCIHELFADQAAKRPQQAAVLFKNERLSYAGLDRRANQLAHHLQSLGVKPDTFVGVYMNRSLDLMIALLGILKAGGSYLPLDPAYPAERLAFMVEDTATPVIVSTTALAGQLPPHRATVVEIDGHRARIQQQPQHAPQTAVTSNHLSYIIYTSGSTGKPKGVMVEHRSVINFFVGMDERIPRAAGDVWLATTSLSFDISVLELFWTLTRGLTVVLDDSDMKLAGSPTPAATSKPITFSLFYFASDASEGGISNKYQLLLDGARFADENGFEAVWTPERHFHAFGGLYPNPAVTGSAVAAVTKKVKIRAGSLVSPLHHPIRIAEDWAVLDNISNGRVGISFASGWQPNDFVLAPDNFANNKTLMFEQIELVKQLWRGETLTFPGPKGKVEVQTLPRPVQPELPVWVTAAGNPETFRMAGASGFNLLTHLLGQSVEDLSDKLAIYRQAWRDAGHPGEGHVTLMLHTYVGDDAEKTKELVRPHLKNYLRSAVFLIKQAAWSFPTFKQKATATGKTPLEIFESDDLTAEEMDALLDFAFERYYENSGLLGTIDKCEAMVNAIKGVGVDEIACQIDFGVPSSETLAALENLNRLYQKVGGGEPVDGLTDFSIPALIERHNVSHFQCTPSMMSMLLVDDRMPAALGRLKVCMLGGEALPHTVADPVIENLRHGQLINMYGPTETTIWSSTAQISTPQHPITIGRPIANTQLYIVDGLMQPVPTGVAGELLIGGDGVVRGYHKRPQLTAERFIADPFGSTGSGRVYRTGDLARLTPDGEVEFLGRLDFQVKIRGYRIELGEIEALLGQHHQVREAIVTAREDTPGDKRLVAYIIPYKETVQEAELRQYLGSYVPDFMVPGHFVVLDRFPLTPNNKTDRKALPAPQAVQTTRSVAYEPPQNQLEEKIAAIWSDLLNLPQIGVHDSFFDLGGHSLLAVQAHRLIREALNVDFSIADVFRYATIHDLAAFLNNQEAAVQETHKQAENRAAARRHALGTRVQGRRRR